ncbi:MAG: SOS response-associated peptidase [bacterium]
MGTHYSLHKEPKFLEKRFSAVFDRDFQKVYHVSAFDNPLMPVITNHTPDKFSFLYWGLIPFWLKDKKQIKQIRTKTLNARAETLFNKPSFKIPIRKKRCLIVADGYFEWREVAGKTYPYYIHKKDNDTFTLAGIWDEWTDEENTEILRTFSMISIEANPFIKEINNRHQRMPVILPEKDEKKWIRSDLEEKDIKSMLKTYDENDLDAYPVKQLIGKKNVDSNIPEILEKYYYNELEDFDKQKYKGDSKQTALF